MSELIASLEEAKGFFLSNSEGECLCIDGEREKVCECYLDAVEFYNNKEEGQ